MHFGLPLCYVSRESIVGARRLGKNVGTILKRIGRAQFDYHFNFLPRYNLFYVEVSKAGCTSMKSFLLQNILSNTRLAERKKDLIIGRPHRSAMPSPFVKPYQIGEQRFIEMMNSGDFTVLAVVRNPGTRLMSAYNDKIVRKKPQYRKLAQFLRNEGLATSSEDRPDVSVEVFCKYLMSLGNSRAFDQHWRPQFEHLSPDVINYTHIVQLEKLDQDLPNALAASGLKWDRRQAGKHHTNSTTVDIGNGPLREALQTVYLRDYDAFGYKFG